MDETNRDGRGFERWVIVAIALTALYVIQSFLAWLVLAGWIAALGRPLFLRLKKRLGGRERSAGVLLIGLVLAVLVPMVLVLVSLTGDAIELAKRLSVSDGGRAALSALASGGDSKDASLKFDISQVIELVRQHGDRAWGLISAMVGAATNAFIGVFIMLIAAFTFLVDAEKTKLGLARYLPISKPTFDRFSAAFVETGRGLFVGVGLTGLVQAILATVTYVALGVPRPLVLGVVTLFASIVPSFGTALVWGPVAAGLALTGRTGAAAILVLVGVVVVGSADNVLRPLLAHRAHLAMPTLLLMVAMFGGLEAFDGWGLILGPLIVRIAMEALAILRESRGAVEPDPEPPISLRE